MTNVDTQVKEFVQEVLKINGLIAAEELSSIASKLLVEKNDIFHLPADKKQELNKLLKMLNEELAATRESHEAVAQKAEGMQTLIKPFSNVFNYIAANTHEQRAKDLATEAAKFFLKEEATHLIRKALQEGANKIQNSSLSSQDNFSGIKDNISEMKDKFSSKVKSLKGNDEEDDSKSFKSAHKNDSTKGHSAKEKGKSSLNQEKSSKEKDSLIPHKRAS